MNLMSIRLADPTVSPACIRERERNGHEYQGHECLSHGGGVLGDYGEAVFYSFETRGSEGVGFGGVGVDVGAGLLGGFAG